MHKRNLILFAALAVSSLQGFAQANNFPNRPLSVIVPFGPGSSSDTNARFVAEKLAVLLGQPVTVENKPGASGAIGLRAVKSLPADGYTIVQASISPMAVTRW